MEPRIERPHVIPLEEEASDARSMERSSECSSPSACSPLPASQPSRKRTCILREYCGAAEKIRAIGAAVITDAALTVNKELLQTTTGDKAPTTSEDDDIDESPFHKKRRVSEHESITFRARKHASLMQRATLAKRMAEKLRAIEDLHRQLLLDLVDVTKEEPPTAAVIEQRK